MADCVKSFTKRILDLLSYARLIMHSPLHVQITFCATVSLAEKTFLPF